MSDHHNGTAEVCWSCRQQADIDSSNVTLHHMTPDRRSYHWEWWCRACGHTNVRPVTATRLLRLLNAIEAEP